MFALNAAAPLAGAVAGILAYCTYNAVVFGGIVPVSAAAKEWVSQRIWDQEGGYSLTENVHAFLRSGYFDDELLAALEVCVYAGVVWWFSRRSRGRDDWLLLAFLVGVFGLAAGHLAKFAQSVLTVHPDSSKMHWYFVPAYFIGVLVVPVRCCVAVWFVRRFLDPKAAPRVPVPSLGIVAIGAVLLLATADFTRPFQQVDALREDTSRNDMLSLRMGAMVMNRLLPEDSVVGIRNSGVVGYFSRFPVVNRDGMVNSWRHLRALKEGTEAAFHRLIGITDLAGLRPLAAERGTAFFEGPSYGTAELRQFKLWPPEWGRTSWSAVDRAEWLRERTHHLEHSDGVGLLVDGRLAQAFVRDCAGGLAAWTWAGQTEPVRVPWTPTSIGFCASAVVLPHDARPPVRVVTMTAGDYLTERVGGRRPAIAADFDVHLVEDRSARRTPPDGSPPTHPPGARAVRRRSLLVYAKDGECGPEDFEAPFFAHVDPVDPGDLPGPRRRHGFDNLDFWFGDEVLMIEPCVAEVPVPEYGIAAIRTGQYVEMEGGFHSLWEGEIRFGPADRAPLGERLADRVRGRRPAIESDFDVYLVDDALVYVKEACGPEDADTPFFLHVEAVDPDALPVPRRRHGFDNLDFRFDGRGARLEGACLAEVPLPEYGIAAIRTGQFVEAEGGFHRLWEGEIR